MKKFLMAAMVSSAVVVTGCGASTSTLAIGGVGGAAAGAGTGAIIGSVIANGDVAASALLGTAVGLPAGIAIAAVYDYYSTPRVIERKMAQIEANQDEIFDRQRQIDELREQIRNDGPAGNPAEELREYHYSGPSLGRY